MFGDTEARVYIQVFCSLCSEIQRPVYTFRCSVHYVRRYRGPCIHSGVLFIMFGDTEARVYSQGVLLKAAEGKNGFKMFVLQGSGCWRLDYQMEWGLSCNWLT